MIQLPLHGREVIPQRGGAAPSRQRTTIDIDQKLHFPRLKHGALRLFAKHFRDQPPEAIPH
jgi:hypothetical protein